MADERDTVATNEPVDGFRIDDLTTPGAIQRARVVERAFAIWWRDNAAAWPPKEASAAAFRAGFDLARQLFLDIQRAGVQAEADRAADEAAEDADVQ